MSKKENTAFLEAYISLETLLNQKFQLKRGGITEYVNRLIDARFAPDRDDVLPRIVRYRNIRNRMAHEDGALADVKDIARSDVRWLKNFARLVEKEKDPIALYLKRARNYERKRRFFQILAVVCTVLALVALAVVLFSFDSIKDLFV